MSPKKAPFIPALGLKQLTPLYDPLLKWVMFEDRFKQRLIEQAQIRAGHRILDQGCGTGTLTIMIQLANQQAELTGLDVDREVLMKAQQKAHRSRLPITFVEALAWDLPYPANYFDRILSSLMVHHLTQENKRRTFREIFRVLKPGGEFHILDFGKPHTVFMRGIAAIMQNLEETADNFADQIPRLLEETGFTQVEEKGHHASIFGPISRYRGEKAGNGYPTLYPLDNIPPVSKNEIP